MIPEILLTNAFHETYDLVIFSLLISYLNWNIKIDKNQGSRFRISLESKQNFSSHDDS